MGSASVLYHLGLGLLTGQNNLHFIDLVINRYKENLTDLLMMKNLRCRTM